MDHDRATVLEASRANVFIVEGDRLVTPPADGRILPGVTRARLLALLDVREEIVSLDRLADADEAFLSGSVRGVEAVSVCGGRRDLGARAGDTRRRRPTETALGGRTVIETSNGHELQFVIVMDGAAADDEVEDVLGRLAGAGAHGRVAPGRDATVIGAIGEHGLLGHLSLDGIGSIERVLEVSKPYKLVALETSPEPTVIQVRGRRVGGDHFALIAGPCAVESREQTLDHRAGGPCRRGEHAARRRVQAADVARTAFAGSARMRWRSSARRARRPGCRSSPSSWTRGTSTSSPPTRT